MITVCLATIPERDATQTINSLKSQVDQLIVVHNLTYRANNRYGDAAKFLPLFMFDGYFFTCDDDLIYPEDYVQTMIKAIEKYKRQAFITLHGRTFEKRKINSYYRDKKEGFRCLDTVIKDVQVDSGGTGVMAWHSDLFFPTSTMFRKANMADIWIARQAKTQGIPIICIAHKANWIQYVEQPEGATIWDKKHNNDSFETDTFNTFWP